MNQNSFQKNGLLNMNSSNVGVNNNGQLGRRNIQDIRDDMLAAKFKKVPNDQNTQPNTLNQQSSINKNIDYHQRVENMQNFNRWK